MAKEVKINIGSYFDASGVKESNDALAKLARDVAHTNDQIRQSTLRAAASYDSFAAQADKAVRGMGGGYKTLAQQLEELKTSAAGSLGESGGLAGHAAKANGQLGKLLGIVGKLVPSFGSVGVAGAGAFGAIGAAVGSVISFAKALYTLLDKLNGWSVDKDLQATNNTLARMSNEAELFGANMEAARETSAKLSKNLTEELEALHKLTKAQIEYNRAQELALATSKEQRAEIEARYHRADALADQEAERARLGNLKNDLDAEHARLREEVSTYRRLYKSAQAQHDAKSKETKERVDELTGNRGWEMSAAATRGIFSVLTFGAVDKKTTAQQRADSSLRSLYAIDASRDEYRENLERAQEALKANELARKNLATQTQAFETRAKASKISLDTAETERKNAEEAELSARAEADHKAYIKRCEDQIKEAEREIEKIAAERRKIEESRHKEAMDHIRAEISEEGKRSSVIESRAAAAASEFDRAFAWYRDPNAAKRAIGEEQDYRNDLERLHRDASRYGGKWRIDELSRLMSAGDTRGVDDTLAGWRKSRSFSPQVEALVRASAAEQTRTTLEDDVRRIAANTAKLDEQLKELLTLKGGE